MSATVHTRLSWLGVAVLVAGALLIGARPPGGGSRPEARVERIAAELRCPVCQGLSVRDSDSSTARSIRGDVERRIADGQSDAEIRQAYVDRYGEWILLRPRGTGFGAVVWLLPVAAVAAGLLGLAVALRRWRSRLANRATADDRALVERALGQRLGSET
ncbi:MAG: cytochrome c-type biogenesis protein [Acidimicrobiales bacterium]